jgi:DNA-directed RNA polymerase subunit RPC12/RpoP
MVICARCGKYDEGRILCAECDIKQMVKQSKIIEKTIDLDRKTVAEVVAK